MQNYVGFGLAGSFSAGPVAAMSRPEIGLQSKSVNDEKDPIRTVVPRSRGIGVKF